MDQDKMTPLESIGIIENAIKKASREQTGAAYYNILWGSLIFAFALCNYFALTTTGSWGKQAISLSWFVFPLGGLLSYLHNRKTDRIETRKPLHDSLYSYVWGGVGLCLGVMTASGPFGGWDYMIPVAMMLFGLAAFIIGGVTGSRASFLGGFVCVLLAGASIHKPLATQCLLGAAAVLSSNLLPGLLMKLKKE